jgi:hypothetical protein
MAGRSAAAAWILHRRIGVEEHASHTRRPSPRSTRDPGGEIDANRNGDHEAVPGAHLLPGAGRMTSEGPPPRSPGSWWRRLNDPVPPGQRALVLWGGFALLLFIGFQVDLGWIAPLAYLVLVPLALWLLGRRHRRRRQ